MQPETMETYTTAHVASATGASYRQLDYWTRTEVIRPALPARGSGTVRRWSREDAAAARVAVVLARFGAPCPVIRSVVSRLQEDPKWWSETVVIFDGGVITPVNRALGRSFAGAWMVDLRQAWLDVGMGLSTSRAA